MRGEAVAKCVAANFFCYSRSDYGGLHALLQKVFVAMMAPAHSIFMTWIDAESARGKEKLPAQLLIGVRRLSLECVGQPDAAIALSQIAFVNAPDLGDLVVQSCFGASGQRHDAVFFAFAIAHNDLSSCEIHVFDAKSAAFEYS